MPSSPNKLSQFWQELKRRNVVRVITVYAGAAFVIIELINNITEPLHLPEWTPTLVIVLLAIGFPIVIIISWIYDVHPEGGMVKTIPSDNIKAEAVPKSSNGWKIATYISIVVIVGLIVLNIIPRSGKKEILDKSIAVLPFKNDSPDEEKMYFINGTMDAILDNLCKIADLRVVSRNSVEQYRDNPKPTPVVAEEMHVSFVLEGSGQKIGNRVLLIVQLLDGKTDQHLWSKQYDREIEKVEDLIDIQSEIAQLVAGEIEAVITPEEKQLMEKIPTADLSAYDYFQRGMEEYGDYNRKHDVKALDRADNLFHEALRIDSTYAQAYAGLAIMYAEKQAMSGTLIENADSMLTLVNIALSYDDQSYEVYITRGNYYRIIGNYDLALSDYEKAIRLNPNSGVAYFFSAIVYRFSDFVKTLELLHKAINLDRGEDLSTYLLYLGLEYYYAGFLDKSNHYYSELLKLSGESYRYYYGMAMNAYYSGEGNKAIDYARKAILLDSTSMQDFLGEALLSVGKHKEALEVYRRWLAHMQESVLLEDNWAHRIAYAYWINGLEKEAEYYFEKQIEYSLSSINLKRNLAQAYYSYYDLAGIYAFRAEKVKAYENLRLLNQIKEVPFWLNASIKNDYLFDSIRNESEFQQIVRDLEAKYQASHERVKQWLEDNDML